MVADQVDHVADRVQQFIVSAPFKRIERSRCLRRVVRFQGRHRSAPSRPTPPAPPTRVGGERIDVFHQLGLGQQPGLAHCHHRSRAQHDGTVRLDHPQVRSRRRAQAAETHPAALIHINQHRLTHDPDDTRLPTHGGNPTWATL